MHLMSRRRWLCGGLALLATGCSLFAVRPPTPAASPDLAALNAAAPGERFYCLIFASQTVPRRPAFSHTWATVVRAADRPGSCPLVQDVHTISWLPATLDIRPLCLCVEPGVNLDLHETIAYARGNGERVSVWGPYECRPNFFRRFLVQKAFLDSGRVGYQCDDNCGEAALSGNGCCCIHAISDMDPEYGRANYPLIWFGDSASEHLVNRFHASDSLLHPDVEHDWLIGALGLEKYGLVRRHYHDRRLDFPRLQPARILGRGHADRDPAASDGAEAGPR
jgi:hypothetical protein